MLLRAFVVFAFLGVAFAPTSPLAVQEPGKPKKYALLVGINKYEHAEMNRPQPLQFAEADVTELAELLRSSDYEVDLLTGEKATKKAIDDAIANLKTRGNSDGVVLVALAGHGMQLEKEKDAYFCPFDCTMREAVRDGKKVLVDGKPVIEPDPASLVKLTDIVNQFALSKAGTRILLADCCRNDQTSGRGRGVGSGIKTDELPANTAVLLSCSQGQQAWEDKRWGHGAFFYHVLQGLRDGNTTVTKLQSYLEEAVPNEVKKLDGAPEQDPHPLINGRRLDFGIVRANAFKPGEERDVEIAEGVKMRFCWVPPGAAQLGSPKAERDEVLKLLKETTEPEWLASEAEGVRGKFTTKGFWLGKYEVTQAEWRAVMGSNPSYFDGVKDNKAKGMNTDRFPVEGVSWDDCQEFVKKMNGRAGVKGRFKLPHEDEWEYACRSGLGNGRPYYFGPELNGTQANCDGNHPYGTMDKGVYKQRTEPVGSYAGKAGHPWGLCDMHGNVYEWCDNKYKQSEYNRVLRGGSWNGSAHLCRAANRNWIAPDYRDYYYGCRLVFSLDL